MERPPRYGEQAGIALPRVVSPPYRRPDLRELLVMDEEDIEPHHRSAHHRSGRSFFGSPKASSEELKPTAEPRVARVANDQEEREQLEMLKLIRLHDDIGNAWLPRRLALRAYITWLLSRRARRKVMRGMLAMSGWCIKAAAAWCLLILVPAQLAFDIVVTFNWCAAPPQASALVACFIDARPSRPSKVALLPPCRSFAHPRPPPRPRTLLPLCRPCLSPFLSVS
jgi:hypothetical protein